MNSNTRTDNTKKIKIKNSSDIFRSWASCRCTLNLSQREDCVIFKALSSLFKLVVRYNMIKRSKKLRTRNCIIFLQYIETHVLQKATIIINLASIELEFSPNYKAYDNFSIKKIQFFNTSTSFSPY